MHASGSYRAATDGREHRTSDDSSRIDLIARTGLGDLKDAIGDRMREWIDRDDGNDGDATPSRGPPSGAD